MTVTRYASPIYKVNFWGNNTLPGLTDGPDPEGWDRAEMTHTYPQTEKGTGSLSRLGEWGYLSGSAVYAQIFMPYLQSSRPLNSTSHWIYNFLSGSSQGGAIFRLKVPPGNYQVSLVVGTDSVTGNDVSVNGTMFVSRTTHGYTGASSYPQYTHTVDARNGFIDVSIGRTDLINGDASTFINWLTVEPVIYEGDEYPDLVSTTLDPSSPADQALVTKLVQRDLALTERPVSFTLSSTIGSAPVSSIAMTQNRWTLATQWRVFVPTYANQLILRLKLHMTNNVSFPLIGANIGATMSDTELNATTVNTIWQRGRNEPTDPENEMVALTSGVWAKAYTVVRTNTPTAFAMVIDVRRAAGREAYIGLVTFVVSASNTLNIAPAGSTSRFIYTEGFHENDFQLLGTAALSASLTKV